MIIVRVPLRVSLCGGGSDVPSFYMAHGGGAVLSTAINKYVYITLSEKFDGKTRVSYSQTETVDEPSELQHELARECLNFFNTKGVEITSISDIPGEGTGLGSSSAYTVGLLAALSRRATGKVWPANQLAETAHWVESKMCGHPGIGKQDHYAVACGGFRLYEFNPNQSVTILKMPTTQAGISFLEEHFMLFYTDVKRSAKYVLDDQEINLRTDHVSTSSAKLLRDTAKQMAEEFSERKFYKTGAYLHQGWELKKRLSSQISSPELDAIYDCAMDAGAQGGKLLGAGGGGFFLFFVPPGQQETVRKAIGLRQVEFQMENEGAKIIYDSKCR